MPEFEIKDGVVYRDGEEVKTYDQKEIDSIISDRLKKQEEKLKAEFEQSSKKSIDDLEVEKGKLDLEIEKLTKQIEDQTKTVEERDQYKADLIKVRSERESTVEDLTKQLREKNEAFEKAEADRKSLKAKSLLGEHVKDVIGGQDMIELMIERGTAKFDDEGNLKIEDKEPEEYFKEWKEKNPDRISSKQKKIPTDGENGQQQQSTEDPKTLLKESLKDGIPMK